MKITELKCPNCGAVLKVKEENLNLGECVACGGKFSLEWDHPNTPEQMAYAKPLSKPDQPAPSAPKRIQYTPVEVRHETKESKAEDAKTRLKGLAISIAGGVGFLLIAFLIFLSGQSKDPDYVPDPAKPGAANKPSSAQTSAPAPKKAAATGIFAAFLEEVYEKPLAEISAQEIAQIRYLKLERDFHNKYITYSFENPLDNPDAKQIRLQFSGDQYPDYPLDDLPVFTGLKSLYAPGTLKKSQLAGLALEEFGETYDSLEQIASILEDPGTIRCLNLSRKSFSLKGIESFPNLETLILDTDDLQEDKLLVNAPALKTLSLDLYESGMDFSVFGVMPALEDLTIRSKALKDLGFAPKIKALKALSLKDCPLLTLAPLKDLSNLTQLSVTDCRDLKDMSAVSSLTELQVLRLSLPSKCDQPDLSALTKMKDLYLISFDDTGFLKNMKDLETLTLSRCGTGDASDFAGLTKLKSLSCTSALSGGVGQDLSFLMALPALEALDLHGVSTYDDISGIFNMPTLKQLNISSMQCEIAFDNILENTSLEELSMDHIKLYENVYVLSQGGMTSVWWDDVNLTEHLDFLRKFKGLKTLSIQKNDLTDISFASSMEALERIDFSDNYVSDLSPLSGLKDLLEVRCTENPISDDTILGESVAVQR